MKQALIVVLWLVAGYISHGFMLGGVSWEFPSQGHEPEATVLSYAIPPVGLIVGLLTGGMMHYRQHQLTCQERWEAHEDGRNFGDDAREKAWFVHWANPGCTPEDLR